MKKYLFLFAVLALGATMMYCGGGGGGGGGTSINDPSDLNFSVLDPSEYLASEEAEGGLSPQSLSGGLGFKTSGCTGAGEQAQAGCLDREMANVMLQMGKMSAGFTCMATKMLQKLHEAEEDVSNYRYVYVGNPLPGSIGSIENLPMKDFYFGFAFKFADKTAHTVGCYSDTDPGDDYSGMQKFMEMKIGNNSGENADTYPIYAWIRQDIEGFLSEGVDFNHYLEVDTKNVDPEEASAAELEQYYVGPAHAGEGYEWDYMKFDLADNFNNLYNVIFINQENNLPSDYFMRSRSRFNNRVGRACYKDFDLIGEDCYNYDVVSDECGFRQRTQAMSWDNEVTVNDVIDKAVPDIVAKTKEYEITDVNCGNIGSGWMTLEDFITLLTGKGVTFRRDDFSECINEIKSMMDYQPNFEKCALGGGGGSGGGGGDGGGGGGGDDGGLNISGSYSVSGCGVPEGITTNISKMGDVYSGSFTFNDGEEEVTIDYSFSYNGTTCDLVSVSSDDESKTCSNSACTVSDEGEGYTINITNLQGEDGSTCQQTCDAILTQQQ